MGNVQTAVALTFALAVTFFVPILVWVTLIVGLYQFVRDKIRESRLTRKTFRPIASGGSGRSA